MPFCPVDRDEFQPGMTWCAEHNVALVAALTPDPVEQPPPEPEYESAGQLGIYDHVVAAVVIDLLGENGIRAVEASAPKGLFAQTSRPDRAMILVPTVQREAARTILDEQLPRRLKELEDATVVDPSFSDEDAVPEEPPPETAWGFQAPGEGDEEVEEYVAIPIGFMEPAVARVFIDLCEEVDIGADTEYQLDKPAPAYARADGRVRVHVEEVLVDHAMSLLKEELPEELAQRGIQYHEPLLEPED